MKKNTALCWIYALFLALMLAVFGCFVKQGNWLQTDLRALLPEQQSWTDVQVWADQQQEQALNRQLIVMVGHQDAQQANALVQNLAEQWQKSGQFSAIFSKIQPDLAQLQREIKQLRLAVLPADVAMQLQQNPQGYFQQYAEQILNPFGQTNLLPLEQDWLGLGRFVLSQSQRESRIQWNAENGALFVVQGEKTWVLLRGELNQASLINPSQNLTALLNQNRQQVEAVGGEMLATGTTLFAAQAKQSAESESTLMSLLGVGLTLLLLLTVFRTLRVLWLFLPIAIGLLVGVVATVALFGQVHILTLVIGTSLIGVLIDFPLHWLSGSLFSSQWQSETAMAKLRFTFLITLLITLFGYGLLGFTHLPVLKQTALFSAVALTSAMAATLLFLPKLFCGYQAKGRFQALGIVSQNGRGKFRQILPAPLLRYLPSRPLMISGVMALVLFVGVGLAKSKWQDDIRQWVSMPAEMLNEAQQIAQLTGIDLGNQYFLIGAENDDELLRKDRDLSQRLQKEKIPFQSLSQWIMSPIEQQQLRQNLQQIQPHQYDILQQIGVPENAIRQSLAELQQMPLIGVQQALQTELGQGWRALYLGEHQGNVWAVIKVQNASQNLSQWANQQDVFWQDKRRHLNQSFQQTRDQAAWLKVLSFVLAGMLLWRYFGAKAAAKMLLIPFVAIVGTVAIFGWLSLPISLFTMFGLLLVSAIGIDYTAYLQTAPERLSHKRVAVSLAATTTLISFLLLGLSSTPAVASFGLSVSVGVLLTVFGAFKFAR